MSEKDLKRFSQETRNKISSKVTQYETELINKTVIRDAALDRISKYSDQVNSSNQEGALKDAYENIDESDASSKHAFNRDVEKLLRSLPAIGSESHSEPNSPTSSFNTDYDATGDSSSNPIEDLHSNPVAGPSSNPVAGPSSNNATGSSNNSAEKPAKLKKEDD
jgi:hypothetical protein